MNNKAILSILVVVIVVAAAGIYLLYDDKGGDETGPKFIGDYVPNTAGERFTDATGKEITVPDQLGYGIVTIGSSGPLRFVSCFDVADYVIEVDKGDVTDSKNGRAYSYAYDYTSKAYHADNAITSKLVEDLSVKSPSLVVTTKSIYNNNQSLFNILEKVTTVVAIEDQSMTEMGDSRGGLSKELRNTFNMLGTVFGKEDRAEEIITGIEDIIKDLDSLSGTSDKSVYVAGVTYQGSNTLNSTFPTYMPFGLTGTKNAYNGTSTDYRVTLNVETVTLMPIDIVIIDPSSSDKLSERDSQMFMSYIYEVNNDSDPANDIPLYVTVPIVWDSINYDCALASAYFVDHLVYGSLTLEEVEQKINGIFELFYGSHGKNVFDDMRSFFEGKSGMNGVELPLLGEVRIVKTGSDYGFVAA